jgi:hypothetical protein
LRLIVSSHPVKLVSEWLLSQLGLPRGECVSMARIDPD